METYSRDKSVWGMGRYVTPASIWDNVPIPATDNRKVAKLKRSIDGFKNPQWRTQVANLQNATTPASGYYLTLDYTDGTHWVIWKDNGGAIRKFSMLKSYAAYYCMNTLKLIGPDLWAGTIGSGTAANRATIAFRKKLRRLQVAFSGLTFLGELRESVRMMRHPAQGLSNLARSYLDRVKDAKRKRPRDWKKNLSSMWLEQAFGWRPLMNDINDAFSAYKSLIPTKAAFVSGFGKDESLHLESILDTTVDNGFTFFTQSYKQRETVVVRFRGCVKRTVSAPSKEVLSHFGFEPMEFIPTAWELLPWSFLIDYFVNIGDIIQAYIVSTADVAWVDRSDISTKTMSYNEVPRLSYEKGLHGFVANGGYGSTAKLVSRKWSRSANVGLPLPAIEFSIPGTWSPWANMLALFTQANSSIHRQNKPRLF